MITMKRGKQICKQLKAVRQRIADENGIPFSVRECTHKGDCRGTCPRCEAEVRYLEQALAQRISLGKAATVAGLTLSLTACGGGGEPTLQVDMPAQGVAPVFFYDTVAADTSSVSDSSDDMVVTGMEGDAFVADGFPDRDSSADAAPSPPSGDELIPEEGQVEDEDMLLGMINETQPVFPGGEDALYKFLKDNVVYPSNNGHADTSGIVVVIFKIEKDGSVTDARILRDIGEGYGEAVLKAVEAMPKWKPAEADGKPIRVEFSLPFRFDSKSED